MIKSDFIAGGTSTMAGLVNSLYGSEGSDPTAAWVHANLKPQRPVTRQTVGWDYATLITMVNNYGPACTPADVDASIAAWDGTTGTAGT